MLHLLLVESDPAMRAVFRCTLAATDVKIHERDDARQALAYLSATTIPHIVLVSNAAPGRLAGMPIAPFLAAAAPLPSHHRFVLASTLADGLPPHVQALVQSLHIPVVKKPIDPAILAHAIASCAADLASTVRAPSAHDAL